MSVPEQIEKDNHTRSSASFNFNVKMRETKSNCHYLTDFQRQLLQKNLDQDLPQKYRQRIEIMLMADEGKTQGQICKTLGCSPTTARHWILMAQSGQGHKWQQNPIGRPQIVNEKYLERLKELVTQSPKAFGYVFRRWTAHWLSQHLAQEFGIKLSERHIHRLLKQMGLSTKPQRIKTEEISAQNLNNQGIMIRDLASDLTVDSLEQFTLHSITLR